MRVLRKIRAVMENDWGSAGTDGAGHTASATGNLRPKVGQELLAVCPVEGRGSSSRSESVWKGLVAV